MKKIYWFLIVATLICLGVATPVNTISYEKADVKTTEEDGLSLYLDALATYECRDCPHGYKRLDANTKYSYGCLQFQRATFDEMVRKYRLVPERKGDDSLDISRCEDQKRVARAMFQDNPRRAAGHWYTSIYPRGLGLPK